MIVEKITEIKFNYYFFLLENVNNNLLIDDSENSLSIYDSDLKLLKKIINIPEFGMHFIYKNCNNNTLLFNSGDDPYFLWVNLETKQSKLIDVSHIQDTFLQPYSWENDYLILVTQNGEFYHYDNKKYIISKLPDIFVKKYAPEFFYFYQYYNQFPSQFDVNSCNKTFIQFDYITQTAIYHDFGNSFTITTRIPYKDDHFMNIRYFNSIFVFLYEHILFLCHNDTVYKLFSDSTSDIFQNASFLENKGVLFLFIHMVDKCDFYKGKVLKYQIKI